MGELDFLKIRFKKVEHGIEGSCKGTENIHQNVSDNIFIFENINSNCRNMRIQILKVIQAWNPM